MVHFSAWHLAEKLAVRHYCQCSVSCMAGSDSGRGATGRWPRRAHVDAGRYLVFRPEPSRSSRTSCSAARLLLGTSKLTERGHPHLSPLFTVPATSVGVCLCMPLLFPAFLPVGPFYPPSERLIVKKSLKCKPHEKTKGLGKSDSFNNNKHTSTNLLREINEQEKRTPQHPHLSLLQMDGARDARITIPRPPGGVSAVDQAEGENAAVCVRVCVCVCVCGGWD